ncbi:glycosyltransferase family 2 protein [Streptomyces sp. 35G-GA-8]|uniref:glycosyltransferase n=1 Tax=Streptomyces sp. 35G-GA-8 TaxID=2939434 RepID=UPI00201EC0FE|nr:glycosyltransferase [Streptomyces sp. 35G-GA-8]MCL7380635.1 glycosyltransferase [Streptomyces sp. 35G-GA-8]
MTYPSTAAFASAAFASVAVAELDLDGPGGPVLSLAPAPGGSPLGEGYVYALVRLRGRPAATVLGRVGTGEDPAEVLTAAFRARKGRTDRTEGRDRTDGRDRTERKDPGRCEPAPAGEPYAPPRTTVVVATRERAGQLARALDSLLAQDHPDFRVLVVDNAPVTSATRDLVTSRYAGRVDYVHEPRPGLALAHNRGLDDTDGAVVAFTDDDVIADPHWLTALTTPFAADPGLGCVTGLILPARLTTPAQILLESHGGFAKGFEPRVYDPARPPADEPLFPFAAGSFGSGANMAFRADALRAVGGFDPATGTGTPARGGDDLYAFVRILSAGHRLRYMPSALVWHHHRETWQDLENQAYGYGAGLTAYLTAILVRRPALLPALLARLPRGLAHARAITAHRSHEEASVSEVPSVPGVPGVLGVPGAHGTRHHPWPRSLSRLERRGMLYGPLGYARARRRTARDRSQA